MTSTYTPFALSCEGDMVRQAHHERDGVAEYGEPDEPQTYHER